MLLAGLLLFGGVIMALDFDFTKLSTTEYRTVTHTVRDAYSSIRIEADTADILFLPAEDGVARVVCYEEANATHSVSVADGTLTVKVNDTRAWYEHIGIRFGTPKITLYLPAGEYGLLSVKVSTGDVSIPSDFAFLGVDVTSSTGDVTLRAYEAGEVRMETSTGAIRMENARATFVSLSATTGSVTLDRVRVGGTVTVRVSTGETRITDLTCRSLYSYGNTGRISLTNTVAREKIEIKRSTGNVLFAGCDATDITVETNTGSVRGSLASPKDFDAKSDTGRVRVPDTTVGGSCKIRTETGEIYITLD